VVRDVASGPPCCTGIKSPLRERPIRTVKAEVIGLDVDKGTIVWCHLDRRGQIVGEGSINADRQLLSLLLDAQIGRRKTHVALEASGCFLLVIGIPPSAPDTVGRMSPERGLAKS